MENAKELITSSYEKQKKWMEEHYLDHVQNVHNDNELDTLAMVRVFEFMKEL